ncbi:MAG TPA: VacJ family lipoprotein [Azospira sp.]|nr:VacJ family lipoprotein [Azospira sp.]
MFALAAALVSGLSGCASTANNPKDPWEGFNRAMFSFNEGVDKAVLKPVAQGYDYVLPQPVQTGVGNFFGNIADVFIAVNNLLQGKPAEAVSDTGRFLVNTTIGVLGVFDVASSMGLEKHDEDFGQTFGRWGVGDGPYVVWPFIGSRNVRDTVGYAVDVAVDPVWNIDHVPTRNSLAALRIVDTRASLLPAEKVINDAALDKYSYMRDAYVQHRKSVIYDGNPPREKLED